MTLKRRIHRLQGGGRTVLWDSFTDADGAVLSQHAPDSGFPWRAAVGSTSDPVFDTNRIRNDPTNTAGHMIAFSRLRRRNGEVAADIVRTGTNIASSAGLLVRAGDAFQSPRWSYDFQFIQQATPQWRLLRNEAAAIATSNATLTQDQVYRAKIAIRGSVILCYVDGVLTFRTEDVQTRRGFRVGLRLQHTAANAPALRLDNWLVTR